MANPLLLFRPVRRRTGGLRRSTVEIPTDVPTTDAVFLLLRRMRMPLLALITVFTIAVFGLAAAPGVDTQGRPDRLSVFEAFYVMSSTATTIGFGEIPHSFSTEQRLWVAGTIYATVIAWAWAIGMLLALIQEDAFRDALAVQRFRRKVLRLNEPFHLITGYGEVGRSVAAALDSMRRRIVVIERQGSRIDKLATQQLAGDPPGLEADSANPAVLGLAGLGSGFCEGVLALTDNDDANLAVVQAVRLLKPDVPVIARCVDPVVAEQMVEYGADAVINPYDRFGDYLVLGLRRPVVHQLILWLIAPTGTPLGEPVQPTAEGTWVVCAEGRFRQEVSRDLRQAGYTVTETDPTGEVPDLTGVVGFVGGHHKDTINLVLGARVRSAAPDVFICLRQSHAANAPLFAAFDPDSVFVPTELVARECVARIVTPRTWAFLEHAKNQSDEWAQSLLEDLLDRVGTASPMGWRLRIDGADAPAVVRWLAHDDLTIADLLRHPSDRDRFSPCLVLALTRDGRLWCHPPEDTPLRVGDDLLIASVPQGYAYLRDSLYGDAAVEYAATGRQVPSTWVWRKLSKAGR